VPAVQRWRIAIALVALALVTLAVVTRADDVADAIDVLRGLPATALVAMTAATAVQAGLRANVHWLATRGLGPRHAVMLGEVHVAATNGLVAGGAVSAGLRITMLRSWSVGPDVIATSLVAIATATSAAIWLVATTAATTSLVIGTGDGTELAVAIAGCIVLGGGATVLAVALWHQPTAERWAAWLDTAVEPMRHRFGSVGPLQPWVERFQADARALVAGRGPLLVVAAVATQLALAGVAAVAVGAVDVAGVTTAEVFVAFAIVRVLASLAPLPGGLGITELGLTAMYVDAGATTSEAVAAVLLFRAFTYLLPIATGTSCVLLWRVGQRRSARANELGERAVADDPTLDGGPHHRLVGNQDDLGPSPGDGGVEELTRHEP
jgi:uncharacterized membrane protein YbhN (UPF0104 family)